MSRLLVLDRKDGSLDNALHLRYLDRPRTIHRYTPYQNPQKCIDSHIHSSLAWSRSAKGLDTPAAVNLKKTS